MILRSTVIFNFCWPNWPNFWVISKNMTKFGPVISIENQCHTDSQAMLAKPTSAYSVYFTVQGIYQKAILKSRELFPPNQNHLYYHSSLPSIYPLKKFKKINSDTKRRRLSYISNTIIHVVYFNILYNYHWLIVSNKYWDISFIAKQILIIIVF